MTIQTAEEKWPDLAKVAMKIANTTVCAIQQHVQNYGHECRYPHQMVLEMVIRELTRRV